MKLILLILLTVVATVGNSQTEYYGFANSETWADLTSTYSTIVDINGDGKADLVELVDGYLVMTGSNGIGWVDGPHNWATPADFSFNARADVNGDGFVDLVSTSYNNVYVYLGTGNWSFSERQLWTTGTIPLTLPQGIWLGDVNGDGKADLVRAGNPGVTVGISNGTSFAPDVRWTPVGEYSSEFGTGLADLNYDGKADLIRVWRTVDDYWRITVKYSTGTSFSSSSTLWASWDFSDPVYSLSDFTGDLKSDLLVRESKRHETYYRKAIMRQSKPEGGIYTSWEDWSNDRFLGFYAGESIFADVTGDGKPDGIKLADDLIKIRRVYNCNYPVIPNESIIINTTSTAPVRIVRYDNIIRFQPGARIKAARKFTAAIAPCDRGPNVARIAVPEVEELTVGTDSLREVRLEEYQQLRIYPNPVSDILTVSLHAEDNGTAIIGFMTETGKVILNEVYPIHIGMNVITLSLSGNASGVYLLSVNANNKTILRKVLIK